MWCSGGFCGKLTLPCRKDDAPGGPGFLGATTHHKASSCYTILTPFWRILGLPGNVQSLGMEGLFLLDAADGGGQRSEAWCRNVHVHQTLPTKVESTLCPLSQQDKAVNLLKHPPYGS